MIRNDYLHLPRDVIAAHAAQRAADRTAQRITTTLRLIGTGAVLALLAVVGSQLVVYYGNWLISRVLP